MYKKKQVQKCATLEALERAVDNDEGTAASIKASRTRPMDFEMRERKAEVGQTGPRVTSGTGGKVLKNQQSWRMLIAVPTAADVAAAGDTEVQPDVVY